MKKHLLYSYGIAVFWVLLFFPMQLWSQTILAQWTFPISGTSVTPDIYSVNNSSKIITCTQTISDASGNGTKAASANGWSVGNGIKNWVIEVNTQGFNEIKISSEQRSSNTGPKDFKLQYKIGSGSWNDLPSGSTAVEDNFTKGVLSNIPITSGSNLSSLFIRWVMTSNIAVNNTTVADTGTSRIDNVKIVGTAITASKPEPSNFPTGFTCGSTADSTIPLSWADSGGPNPADGYLIQWSSISYAAIADPQDGTAIANGSNAQNVLQGIQSFTATGLASNISYFFKIWSYTNSGSAIDYKLVGEPRTQCLTLAAPCSFLEEFSNISSSNSSSYQSRTWTGVGGTWNATIARTDQILTGKALATNDNGSVTAPLFTNGLGNLNFNYVRAFIGNGARMIQIWINGSKIGSDIVVSSSSDVVQNLSLNINVSGNVQLELRTSGAQIIIDDLQWTCFGGTPEANINIQGNGITIIDGDSTPSLSDGTDFGAAILPGTAVEKTFTLQNIGSANLTLDSPAVVLLDGTKGFTIVTQPVSNPMSGFTNQVFQIKFNNTNPGNYTETVLIGSNDPDTSVYSFDLKAIVSQPNITIDKTSLSGFTYAFSQGPSGTQSFLVNGSNLGSALTLTASSNWEISTNLTYDGNNNFPWTTLTLSPSSAGAVTNKTIHVRLKDGLEVGSYSGSISLSFMGAITQTVLTNGVVTAGIRDIKVTGNGTSIANGSLLPSGLNNTLFASQNLGNSQTKSFEIKNIGGAPLTLGTVFISGSDAAAFSVLNGAPVGTTLNQNQSIFFQIKFAPTTIGPKNATVSIDSDDPDAHPYVFSIRGGAVYCSSPGEIIVAQQDFEPSPTIPGLNFIRTDFGVISPGPNTGFSSGSSGSNSKPKNNNLYADGARGYRIQGADSMSEIPSGVHFTFDPVDTSSYTNISLSFKIAGFSLGSVGNGIDDLDAANLNTTIHADKLDYVLVEVSPDNGITWYKQAKVVSGALNLPWSFGSNGTIDGSRNYAADQNLSYFNSTAVSQYSAISINNLPPVLQLKVRISAQNNALNESWILDAVQIKSTGLVPKVWNGAAWFPSPPTNSDKAIINGNYDSASLGGFISCQCEINPGFKLTVAAGTEVKISDFLVNNGNVLIASEGNLVQVNETDTNSGTGTFKAEQKITLSPARKQYNYISSPAESFNMKDLYKNAVDQNNFPVEVPFVLYHNEGTNTFLNSSGAYIKGRGLAVKEPAVGFTATEITGVFEGKPSNGTFYYSLINSNPASVNRGYNLVGNPYPSNMDLVKFYQNNASGGTLNPTFYFWDGTANTRTLQEGDDYDGLAYAQFNAATPTGIGTPTKATGDLGTAGLKLPTRNISVGQGFMAKIINGANKSIIFSNDTRSAHAAQDFFGKMRPNDKGEVVNRYWLNLISPTQISSNIAVVYFAEGDNDFTKDDSKSLGGSDAIYSIVDGEKLSIDGRSVFVNTDKVELGTSHFVAGSYTISLDAAEGAFTENQPIYLKDHQYDITTNLLEGIYRFTAVEGETLGRFEIIYKPAIILDIDAVKKDRLVVYRAGYNFVIEAPKMIDYVAVYDLSGRLITVLKPNNKRAVLDSLTLAAGIYILKITTNDGLVVNRKISK